MRSSPAPADGPGWSAATCHQLRHTCLTRLREAGMALEAVQAQAGHRSIESTRIYLHLTDDWLAGEYRRASELIDADTRRADRAAGGDVVTAAEAAAEPWIPQRRVPSRVGRAVGPGAAAGRDDAPLPGATHHVPRPAQRRRRRQHAAPARPLADRPTPTSPSSPTSPAATSRTTRCGSPPDPAPRHRRWRRTPNGSGCG